MSSKTINITVESDTPVRIDKFLSDNIEDVTRAKIQYLIKNNHALLNSRIIDDVSHKVKFGDNIDIEIIPSKPNTIVPQAMDLDIVYEDEHLAIINKSAGVVVHPGAGFHDNTLVNGLSYHFKEKLSKIGGDLRPGIVHRLDKNTSGLLVIAKNDDVHAKLSYALQEREISRVYCAILHGTPVKVADTIQTNIARSSGDRTKMEVVESGGKIAITHYKVIKTFLGRSFSVLECMLETGRTHQIRVHMAHIGYPIVGDPEYGKGKRNIKIKRRNKINSDLDKYLRTINRQMLHAKSLTFVHPITQKNMEFQIPLPQDMNLLMDEFAKYNH